MPLFGKRQKETDAPSQSSTPPPPPTMIANWRDSITLEDAEYIVEDFNLPDAPYAYVGFVLTNKRLIALEIRHKTLKDGTDLPPWYEVKGEFPLENIRDVEYKGSTVVYTDEGEYDFGMGSAIFSCGSRADSKFARQGGFGHGYLKKKILEQKGAKAPVTLDFSSLRTVMEKGGLVLTTLACPKCNAPMKIPTDGTETVCEHCGSRVIAQDMFKKLKTLLS